MEILLQMYKTIVLVNTFFYLLILGCRSLQAASNINVSNVFPVRSKAMAASVMAAVVAEETAADLEVGVEEVVAGEEINNAF